MPAAMCMRLRCGGRSVGRVVVLLVRLRQRVGNEPRSGNGARAHGRAHQECTARFIMLAHADSLPVN